MSKTVKFIVNKEGFWQSFVNDIFTIGALVGSLTASHLLVGSVFLDAVLVLMIAFFTVGRASLNDVEVVYGSENMLEYLIKNHPQHFKVEEGGDK
jgi:hypothetical protein